MSNKNVIPHPEGSPQFKFGGSTEGMGSIQKIAKMEPYLVQYTDNDNREQVRVAFRIPGGDATFFTQHKIQGAAVVIPANPWFHKAFVDKLRVLGFEDTQSEAVGSV